MLDEIRATYNCGIYYPVVSSVLMLPDACGAVEYWGQIKRPRDRYIEWYDKWVLPHFRANIVNFDGSVLYIVRNAMIHESTGFTRGEHGFDRIFFMPPNKTSGSTEFLFTDGIGGVPEAAFMVTILGLMNAVETGVRNWLSEVRADPDERRAEALSKLVQYRPDGHPPHIMGIPIVS
jgi:hypothetical protein